jgi:hypothetical protein
MRTVSYVDESAPRCSWLERLIDQAQERQKRQDYVLLKPREMASLIGHARRDRRDQGYDPYNTAAMYPEWLKTLQRNRFVMGA